MALEKPATQIGTYQYISFVFTADRAVDGNTDPDAFIERCALLDSFSLNIPCWWYVELGDVYSITKVLLYNRKEAYSAGKISTVKCVFIEALLRIILYYVLSPIYYEC